MSNGFARGFASTFGPAAQQGQASVSAMMRQRLQSKLNREDEIAREERLRKRQIEETKALIKSNASVIGDDTALNEMLSAAEKVPDYDRLIQSRIATLEAGRDIAEMQQPAAGVQAIPTGAAPRGVDARVHALRSLTAAGQQAEQFEFEKELRTRMADIAESQATLQETLQTKAKQAALRPDVATTFGAATAREALRGERGISTRPTEFGLSDIPFGVITLARVGLAKAGFRKPSDADLEFAGQVADRLSNNESLQELVPATGKVAPERIKMIKAVAKEIGQELSEAQILQLLGISKEHIGKPSKAAEFRPFGQRL
jgi:hypothetical protein